MLSKLPEIIHESGRRQAMFRTRACDAGICAFRLSVPCLWWYSVTIPQHVPSGLSLDAPKGAGLVIIHQIIMEEEYAYGETGSLSTPRVRGCSRVDYLKSIEIIYRIFAVLAVVHMFAHVHSHSFSPVSGGPGGAVSSRSVSRRLR